MALSVLDTAVKKIHDALDDAGMLDNTYIIFM
jgi:arylsulfatase A-like enzyme